MAVVAGDFDAFMAVVYDRVRRTLAVALGDTSRAEDVAQEAFARAMTRWERVRRMERPVGWGYRVAVNHARRELRRDQRTVPPVSSAAIDLAGGVATAVTVETALATLPVRQRMVVVLRYLADLSTGEVAKVMGCAEGTVKSSLHTALAKLRVDLDGGEE